MTADDTIISNMDIRANRGGVDDRVLADEDVISNVHAEKGIPFWVPFEGWPDDGLTADHAMAANFDASQISSNDTV